MASTVALEVRSLRREWPQPGGPPVIAVNDVTFEVHPGEIFGLLGPNGAGKSTLMQMLATLTLPTAGTARIAGFDIQKSPADCRRVLGYLSTTSGLPAALTVRECVTLFGRLRLLPNLYESVNIAIEQFQLSAFADRMADTLSTGMRQRLRIACATLHRPPLLVIDEPTNGLDLLSRDQLLGEILRLKADGISVLYSTHIMEEVERISDRIGILHEGVLRAQGTVPEILHQTKNSSLTNAFLALTRP